MIFFFKQKTAYERRISDWSSDVCSSDLAETLWQAWTAPAARAVWAAPSPSVTVEFLEADTRVCGREVWLSKVAAHPEFRCDRGGLALRQQLRRDITEVIWSAAVTN